MNKKKEEEIKIEEEEFKEIEEMEGSVLAEKFQKLKKELKKCQSEKTEYLAGWQRAKADFINARKEEEKTRKDFLKFAEAGILKEILDFMDSFEAMMDNQELWSRIDKNWQNGIKNIYNQLTKILKEHNVSAVDALGKPFNPREQESVESVEVSDENKDQTVIEEVSRGYKLHDLILRPAKVKVGVLK
ncbi:MAG: Protein GrpE [Parcubacteria group bacterium GW2011_GWA2_42_35]|nr:MAG: Protein GrpE [Parcubacteria group bacterium GW2011_GWC2_42_13]KKS58254.1 MAG: Protein GrpE [Parcubacteria group bacterium GW2011_GWA2_42_35]